MRTTKNARTAFAIVSALIMGACTPNELTPSGKNGLSAQESFTNSSAALLTGSVPVLLSSGSTIAVLAGTTITNAGASLITGDIAVSPGTAITGFQPVPINTISGSGTVTAGLGQVSGTIYAAGPIAAQAHNDAVTSYNFLKAQVPTIFYSGVTQLNGLTLTPGIYNFAPSANLQVNGTLTLDFQGNANALFIFQLGTTLVTMSGSNVVAINNNNQSCAGANVYWAVGSSATIDGNQFIGSVIANTTITMAGDQNVAGRLWAINGAVTMVTDTVSVCAGAGVVPVPTKVCRDFVTGGGWIKGSKDKATFGVSGGIKNDKFWGQLSFDDHSRNGVKVKSTSVTNYIVIDAITRQIEGIAKVNGQLLSYKVIVVDRGEPGRNDSFSLVLSNGYAASGTLNGGNIQLHKKCDDVKNNNDKDDHEGDSEHDRSKDYNDHNDHKDRE